MKILKAYLSALLVLLWLALLPAQAAISVTFGSAGQTGGFGSYTLSLSPPAGTLSGDVLIAQISTPGSNVTSFTPPTGWTLISAASTSGGTNIDQRIYYLNLSAAAAASYDWTVFDWSYLSTGVIYSVRGAQPADCGAATTVNCGGSKQAGGGSSVTAPNIGPSFAAGSLRMAFFTDANGSTTITPSTSGGETLGRYNRAGSGATGIGIHGSYYLMSASGNGGSGSATLGNSQSNVGSTLLMAAVAAPAIDHIQIELSGTPLTCTPSTVTVKACANSACSSLASTSTTVTLSASSGTLGSTSLTFTGSTTTTLRKTTTGTTTLGASSSPAATSSTTCLLNGSTAASCQYTFVDSGLLLTIPPQTAGVTSSGATRFSLAAVKKSDSSLACTPAFASVTRNVKFWSNYTSPATGTRTLAVQGTTVGTASPGTSIALAFDSTGTATNLTLNYGDAGQLTLYAQYDGSAGTSDTSLVMTGNTAFATVPYALCVDSPDANWNCAVGSVAAQTPSNCTAFTSAGTAFNLRVSGRAYQAATATCALPSTPNYVQASIPLASTVFAPTGASNGSLGTSTISIASAGTASVSQTQSEVGVFTFTATPAAAAYFGQTVPAGSANFGRFVPAGFTLSGSTLSHRSDVSCPSSTFTYLGEPLSSAFTLTAVNAAGSTTQNYTGSYARLNMGVVTSAGTNGLAFGAQSGATLLNARLTSSCTSCGAFSNGSAAVTASVTVGRSTGSTLNGPYVGAAFGLVATDPDNVGMRSPAYNWDLAGAAEGLSLGTATLYFGRMRIDNAYGSSLLALPVAAYAQYWNGSTFVKNVADNCSRITVPTTTTMVPVGSTTTTTLYCNGGVGLYGSLTGPTATMGAVAAGSVATLLAGDARLSLSKATNSGGGYLDLALSVADYLKYNVDNVDQTLPGCSAVADTYLHDDNPRARIRFGARKNENVIYLREVF